MKNKCCSLLLSSFALLVTPVMGYTQGLCGTHGCSNCGCEESCNCKGEKENCTCNDCQCEEKACNCKKGAQE